MSTIVSPKTYVLSWTALVLLLLGDWIQIQFRLGPWNIVLALLIAVMQMSIGVLVFMHVRSSKKLTWVFVAAGFIWLLIMLDLTLSDYLTRGVPIHQIHSSEMQPPETTAPAP